MYQEWQLYTKLNSKNYWVPVSQARQNKLFLENRLHIYACDKGFYGKDRSQLNRGDKITKNFLDEKLHTRLMKIQSSHSQNVEKKRGKKTLWFSKVLNFAPCMQRCTISFCVIRKKEKIGFRYWSNKQTES